MLSPPFRLTPFIFFVPSNNLLNLLPLKYYKKEGRRRERERDEAAMTLSWGKTFTVNRRVTKFLTTYGEMCSHFYFVHFSPLLGKIREIWPQISGWELPLGSIGTFYTIVTANSAIKLYKNCSDFSIAQGWKYPVVRKRDMASLKRESSRPTFQSTRCLIGILHYRGSHMKVEEIYYSKYQ